MMDRVLRWSPIPTSLLVLAIMGCGGCNSSDENRGAEKPPRSETTAAERPSALVADEAAATRTVVLQVAGMMKSKSGAT